MGPAAELVRARTVRVVLILLPRVSTRWRKVNKSTAGCALQSKAALRRPIPTLRQQVDLILTVLPFLGSCRRTRRARAPKRDGAQAGG